MKAALVFQSLGIGGIERIGVDYAQILLDLGYEVDIYNLRPGEGQMESSFPSECHVYHKSFPELLAPELYFYGSKHWWWGKYVYPLAYLGISFLTFLYRFTMGKRKSYDITIAFSGHFSDLAFVSRNFIKGKKKIAWLHGSLMDYILSSSAYGDIYRKLHNICTLSSDGLHRVLHRNVFFKDLNINQIYNPIHLETSDIDSDTVNELRNTYGDFLLMVGRFDKDKDQQTVIRAYDILYKEHQIQNKLVFVGDGSTLDTCKDLVASLGLTGQIFFTGIRKDVGNFYSAAKLCLHSSPSEGLPTVLLEAMKYHLPIVATDSPPGVNEILVNDTYGLTCNIADPQDMAEKILLMLTDTDTYEHYRQQGQKRIQDFSYESIRHKLSEILATLK